MKREKGIKIIISIICSLLLLLGGTYAAWNLLTEKTDIVMTVGGDQISFDAGTDIRVDGLLPAYGMNSETNVITKEIEIYKENGDYTAGINLYLNLKSWPSAMSSASFRWALYKNGNYLNSGDFSGQKQGNNIKLTSNTQGINLVENKDIYKLYMWIDAYQETNINMMNQSFTVSLYGEATFYKEGESSIANEVEPNTPDLADGMIPIKYNYSINEWVKADTTNTNNDWYDYYNKMWANAVMVTTESREEYMNADVGTTVNEDDILAYYVWIPRYKYVLFNTDFEKINSLEVQIEFQKETDEIFNGTQNGDFLTHPAFWWDNNSNGVREDGEELAGIWVGKFEFGGNQSEPMIKPNIPILYWGPTLASRMYKEFFDLRNKFHSTNYLTDLGVMDSDLHMIKNMEWGAVAYLTYSKYGTLKSPSVNATDYSGRNANYTYNDFIIADGKITHDKEPGMGTRASTTGNIYGIYDMSGGGAELVMAFMKSADGSGIYFSGGFNESNMVEAKYYDLYEYGENSSDYTRSKLGDATGEVVGITHRRDFINTQSAFRRDDVGGTGHILTYYVGNISNNKGASRSVLIVP